MKKNKHNLNIIYYSLTILIILGLNSCISAFDPESCDTPINKSIGVNDTFSISPLKNSYNVGDKIKLLLVVDNIAKLQLDNSEFKLYEKTNEELARIYSGLEVNQDLANLISNPINSIKINFGEEYNNGYRLEYNSTLKKYILELEITLLSKRVYNLKDFSFSLLLGNKPNNAGKNCRFYVHNTSITINPSISFEVR